MLKNTTIIVLGFVVALTPFLGLPGNFKTGVFVVVGLLIAFTAFLQNGGTLSTVESWLVSKKKETDVFAQNEIKNEQKD